MTNKKKNEELKTAPESVLDYLLQIQNEQQRKSKSRTTKSNKRSSGVSKKGERE